MRLWFSDVPDFPPRLARVLHVGCVLFAVLVTVGVDALDPAAGPRWLTLPVCGVAAFILARLLRRLLAYRLGAPFIPATEMSRRLQNKMIRSLLELLFVDSSILFPIIYMGFGKILPHGAIFGFSGESYSFVDVVTKWLLYGVLMLCGYWFLLRLGPTRQAEFRRRQDGTVEQIERDAKGNIRVL